jgi:hypothetical protein
LGGIDLAEHLKISMALGVANKFCRVKGQRRTFTISQQQLLIFDWRMKLSVMRNH